MRSYSPHFETLHDEQKPTGYLGRGTHYSVLRALSWHLPTFGISDRAWYYDFAIIWDEDHDPRIISCIEEIYFNGHLSKFIFFGERKGFFTVVASDKWPEGADSQRLNDDIQCIAQNAPRGDAWNSQVVTLDNVGSSIISGPDEDVSLYLKSINMLWELGARPIREKRHEDYDTDLSLA